MLKGDSDYFFVKAISLFRKSVYICTRLKEGRRQKAEGRRQKFLISNFRYAKIAQLVEHNLAKVRVAGSSPVFRSKVVKSLNAAENGTRSLSRCSEAISGSPVFRSQRQRSNSFFLRNHSCPDGGMVDTKDLKSFGFTAVRVQVPLRVQKKPCNRLITRFFH